MGAKDSNSERGEIIGVTPELTIDTYEEAVEHYVDWLGFNLDWEWRADVDQPVIMHVTRDALSLYLNQAKVQPSALSLRVQVANLEALGSEWNEKRPGSVKVFFEQPFEIPTCYVTDPFGNTLQIQQPATEEEIAERAAVKVRVRAHLQSALESGAALPTPDQIVEAAGCSKGIASEVLSEFEDCGKPK